MKGAVLNPAMDYRGFLRDQLESRIASNKQYSLRSFARDLGIAAPNLCMILRSKKNLSVSSAAKVAMRLNLTDDQAGIFCDLVALQGSRNNIAKRIIELRLNHNYSKITNGPLSKNPTLQLSADTFQVISDWYHFAILELTFTKNFKNNAGWIARSLGISIHEVRSAIERLKRLKLLEEKKGKLFKIDRTLDTTDGVSSEAIQKFNHQILTKALEALGKQKVDERDFITSTFAGDPKKLKVARKIIRRCRNEVAETFVSGEQSEVYCFAVQIFKLSKTQEDL